MPSRENSTRNPLLQTTTPSQLLAATLAAAQQPGLGPVYLGTVTIQEIDRRRAAQMADARRLFNEELDIPWCNRANRHRGGEVTQAKTWIDGPWMRQC